MNFKELFDGIINEEEAILEKNSLTKRMEKLVKDIEIYKKSNFSNSISLRKDKLASLINDNEDIITKSKQLKFIAYSNKDRNNSLDKVDNNKEIDEWYNSIESLYLNNKKFLDGEIEQL